MYTISLVLTIISGLLVISAIIYFKLRKFNIIEATLFSVDKSNNSSNNKYEATYKYTIHGKERLYILDTKKINRDKFKDKIILYYKKDSEIVFERNIAEIMTATIILFMLCLGSCIIYYNIK